jgi:hypothetical protein
MVIKIYTWQSWCINKLFLLFITCVLRFHGTSPFSKKAKPPTLPYIFALPLDQGLADTEEPFLIRA